MTPDTPVRRISVFVGDADLWQHGPLSHEIVKRAYDAGMAGAAVIHDMPSAPGSVASRPVSPSSTPRGLPLVVVILASPERVEWFLPRVEEVVAEGLIVIDEVEDASRPDKARHQVRTTEHRG